MRNLAQYPITRTEKMLKIDELIEAAERSAEAGELAPGDTSLVILREIKKDMEFASDDNKRIVREHHSASSMRSMAAQMSADITPR